MKASGLSQVNVSNWKALRTAIREMESPTPQRGKCTPSDDDDNDDNRFGSQCISGDKSYFYFLPTTGVSTCTLAQKHVCLVSFQILLSLGPLFAGGQPTNICRDRVGMRRRDTVTLDLVECCNVDRLDEVKLLDLFL